MNPKIQRIFFFALLSLSLAGCNLPRQTATTPPPDLVATQVATLLAELPTADLSSTPSPTATTQVTEAASPTVQPAVTATAPASDPRNSLGDPTYRDTFAKAELWGLADPYDDGHTRAEIKDNHLTLTSLKAEGWMGWRTTFPKPGNAYIEAAFSTGACSGGDQYGLVFRSTEESQAAFFGITCDGRYGLVYYDGSQFTRVLNWQESSAIVSGGNQANRLGVWVEGNDIRLYANGVQLTQTTLDSLAKQGNFGVFISGINTTDFSVSLSEIAYWELE